MNVDRLSVILKQLPPDQHSEARKKIVLAESAGYEHIGFWEWLPGKFHHKDLIGFDAHGRLRFLADSEEE